MGAPDVRGQLEELHPATLRAYSDENWRENFIRRSEVSNVKMLKGSEPPMTLREAARFKGVRSLLSLLDWRLGRWVARC